jgi:hypothetical protein
MNVTIGTIVAGVHHPVALILQGPLPVGPLAQHCGRLGMILYPLRFSTGSL